MAIVLPKFPRGSLSTGSSNREGACPILTRLCGLRASYRAHEAIQFDVVVNPVVSNCNAVEVSVIWVTQGKGNEDMGVHFFRRIAGQPLADAVASGQLHFETVLPEGPVSYHGKILKIDWTVRVRMFLNNGEESHLDRSFSLEQSLG